MPFFSGNKTTPLGDQSTLGWFYATMATNDTTIKSNLNHAHGNVK